MRLQVFLSKAGIASRRAAEKLISEGRVTVNGEPVTAMGCQVQVTDSITCDGRPVTPLTIPIYLAVHKPVAVLCTQLDKKNRAKVIDLIPEHLRPGLFHVGRLDYMSSGLIFYTNDGDFGHRVTHPSSEIEKEYWLETEGPIHKQLPADYKKGIVIDGEVFKIKDYTIEAPHRVRLILIQGKNREIRRVCAAYGVKIHRLRRIRIGCVPLDGISPGRFRHLTGEEVAWFKKSRSTAIGPRPRQKNTPGLDQSSSL